MPLTDASSLWGRIGRESGLFTVVNSCRDTKTLCLQRFVRFFAYGGTFLILVDFLTSLGISDEKVGVFMTSTLVGDAVISFLLTTFADRAGRRRVLITGASLMAASGIAFSVSGNFWVLLLASIFGVISPGGNEIGPFKAVEESILAQLTDEKNRSDIFAWYTLIGSGGAALGTLISGWTVQLLKNSESSTSRNTAYRVIFVMYALFGIAKFLLTLLLTPAIEAERFKSRYQALDIALDEEELLSNDSDNDHGPSRVVESAPAKPLAKPPSLSSGLFSGVTQISPASYSMVCRLLVLFFIDSFASGMASPSWLTYFFTTAHSLKPGLLGTLFLVAGMVATISNLVALPLSRRIGPIKTMVFTHLPSAIFLGLVPLPPPGRAGTWLAAAFLVLRSCMSSMDQAPRQAFLSAAVSSSDRTAVFGVVNITKTIAQANGIGVSGFLAGKGLWVVLISGAGLLKPSTTCYCCGYLSRCGSEEHFEHHDIMANSLEITVWPERSFDTTWSQHGTFGKRMQLQFQVYYDQKSGPFPTTHTYIGIWAAIPLEIRSAIAITVIIGLTPFAEGKTLASATYRPSYPQTLPVLSTTLVSGLVPIREVPIWCAELNVALRGSKEAFSSVRIHPINSSSWTVRLAVAFVQWNGDTPGTAGKMARAPDT